jgi:hypothetical protein
MEATLRIMVGVLDLSVEELHHVQVGIPVLSDLFDSVGHSANPGDVPRLF